MSDLAGFLTARLDEDEAAAKAAFGPGIALNWPALPAAVDVFVDRYGPLRAVREVEAKRKIVAEYVAAQAWSYPPGDGDEAVQEALNSVVRHLAAVWSDHPDYDPAWNDGINQTSAQIVSAGREGAGGG